MKKRYDGEMVQYYLDDLLNVYHDRKCNWKEIADDLELSYSHTWRVFNGKSRPGPKACKVLGLTREWTYYPAMNGRTK
jgi:hypothetical protein